MPLFQQSVLKKYIADLDKAKVAAAWQLFQAHFHNPQIQQNIRSAKEEQYQEGFLRELFVQVLGYTLNPQPNFNLTTEYKNEKDSKKADGAILLNSAVRAVIELKGTDTTDLSKIETQAFSYLHNHKGCTYVITSNFEKLRFYISDATDWQEFNLFQLTEADFSLLYLCLHRDSLLADVPLLVKQQSLAQEDAITKKLYADYSRFKMALFEDLSARNPELDRLELFRKTQKLLDRFLFILFAEDRLLLPPNFIVKIVEDWKQLQKLRIQQSLYDRFKLYFNDLLQGNSQEDIFAYNGGLFEPDDLLDNLQVNDSLLMDGVLTLSRYDYNTEVDVNILGHIFEHSLNEIEELQATIQKKAVDKGKTKRKKDGVFYTPRYITKYMVESTIGALCAQKKEELKIVEEEYVPGKNKASRKTLVEKLDAYRSWLLELTICDPACGSGAFLNAALEFLIAEHNYIDELTNKVMGSSLGFRWTPNDILENNLYGVDINEEAVEIARLSLWLRTAQKGRKLSNLSSNIKCGNSLIDDTAVAREKAFNWQQEFEQVFIKGGFDIIIGNPPYVFTRGNSFFEDIKYYIWEKYRYNQGKLNLYSIFLELSLENLLKINGYLGFITPETFIRTSTYEEIRSFVYKNFDICNIDLFGIGVFENVTAETMVMIIKKDYHPNNVVEFSKMNKNVQVSYSVVQKSFEHTPQNRFIYESSEFDDFIFGKIFSDSILLGSIVDVRNGIATKAGKDSFISKVKLSDKYKKLLEAPEIFRYGFNWSGNYICYDKEALHRPRKEETFLSEKILIQRVSPRLICSYDNQQYYTFNSINNLVLIQDEFSLKYILVLLNSKLINYFYRRKYSLDASFTITVTKENLDSIPIKVINKENQSLFIELANNMLSINKELQKCQQNFLNLFKAKHEKVLINKKLKSWPSLSFKEFLKELDKQKIKLTLPEQSEWMQYFEAEKTKANQIQQLIDKTDKEIDVMVYQLYGLTEEEIAIVENA